MWAKVGHHLLLASTQHERICKGGHAGGNLDGPTARIVHDTVLVTPPIDVPRPAGNRAVDEGGPEEEEDHEW